MTKIERLELLACAYLMGRGYDILKINDLKAADAPDWKVAVDFVASHSAILALSATPSPLMAAGEAAETDIMETLDRKIEHAKCMQKRAFDQGLDVQGERMHARQEAFLEVKAILMKGSVATSPAKRDYAARVMGEPTHDQINAAAEVIWNDRDARHGGSWSSVDPNLIAAHQTIATARAALIAAANVTAAAEPARDMGASVDPVENESDQVRCGPIGEDDWKDQRIASLEAYIAQLKDQQVMAEPTRETGKAAEVAHPWYGPCDALAADGACAECIKVAAAEPTREEIAKIIYDAFPFEGIASGVCEKPSWTPGGNSIMQNKARDAADAILALKPRGGTTREETIEECAKVCEAHWSNYKRNYSSACADNALSETGMERVLTVIGAQADTADLLASHLRALSKPRGEPAREGGK